MHASEVERIGSMVIWFIWVSYEKPSSSYCVVLYFWWGCRRNLKFISHACKWVIRLFLSISEIATYVCHFQEKQHHFSFADVYRMRATRTGVWQTRPAWTDLQTKDLNASALWVSRGLTARKVIISSHTIRFHLLLPFTWFQLWGQIQSVFSRPASSYMGLTPL